MLQIISLGLGVQSTALYLKSCMGQFPRADYAIFSDTGREATGTYKYLDFLFGWKERNSGIPIVVCRDKNLYKDLVEESGNTRFPSVPAFTKNENGSVGMLKRQCTYEYKIMVTDNYIRDHIYRLPKGSRRPLTAVWHGITLDEIERMSIPHEAWKINTYPYLCKSLRKNGEINNLSWAWPMTRREVVQWYVEHRLPVPPKSSCVFCPYQSDRSWAAKKLYAPEDFQAAVQVDQAIRNSTAKGIRNPVFLHRSCKPLSEVSFDTSQHEEWGECSGNCHV